MQDLNWAQEMDQRIAGGINTGEVPDVNLDRIVTSICRGSQQNSLDPWSGMYEVCQITEIKKRDFKGIEI